MRAILLAALSLAGMCWQQRADALPMLVVNCLRSASQPPTGTCFNATLGQPYTFWVVALGTVAQIDAAFVGTVHFSASDPTAELPQDYAFKLSDQGAAKFSVTFHTASSANSSTKPSLETLAAIDFADNLQGRSTIYVFAALQPVSSVPLLDTGIGLGGLMSLVTAFAALHLRRSSIVSR